MNEEYLWAALTVLLSMLFAMGYTRRGKMAFWLYGFIAGLACYPFAVILGEMLK